MTLRRTAAEKKSCGKAKIGTRPNVGRGPKLPHLGLLSIVRGADGLKAQIRQ